MNAIKNLMFHFGISSYLIARDQQTYIAPYKEITGWFVNIIAEIP